MPELPVPDGTFLAKARNGAIQLPPLLNQFCQENEWTLFRIRVKGEGQLEARPILPSEDAREVEEFQSSLRDDGNLWIPAPLRASVGLNEQSVMVRVEDGAVNIFLRKIFQTLGFGP